MSKTLLNLANLFIILLLVTAIIPQAGAAAVPKPTRIFLYHYSGYYGGRVTDLAGNPVSFAAVTLFRKVVKNGISRLVYVKKTTACPLGWYKFQVNLPHGTYVAKYFGQPGLRPSTSNTLTV